MNDNKQKVYTQNYMINFDDAIDLIIKNAQLIDVESVNIDDSLGRVLSQSLNAKAAIPAFNNSAMDGYAVNFSDLSSATPDTPISLELVGLTAAGDVQSSLGHTQGKAWKIMTGAPVPSGFDAIIPVENTQLNNNSLLCFDSPKKNAHIRKSGEDFTLNEFISDANKVINANMIMALAAQGFGQINVYKKVNIAIFSTGKELVDDPEAPLKEGQIRNSNKPFINNWLKDLPVNIIDAGTNYDNVAKFEQDLSAQLEKGTQIIISSGAVSMGDFDFIPQTIKKLGGEIIFHKVKIKPGKPILFAKFPNGSFYFGLPGNPISAAIGLRFFVTTLIRNLLGLKQEPPLTAISTSDFTKKPGFRSILKAHVQINSQAQLQVRILEGQESFKIKPLIHANGWAIINESDSHLSVDELISFYPNSLYWKE
ncbi:molybdopterin molybdotransferase MoeA [Aliikangiella sp. IMCC44359]|uniref:molybdopterin molybdotransferase MoeA n=1 Tax=Aliikangiella sp. IMCC44359 TaxID=3459125 RepID=UPI00403B03D8